MQNMTERGILQQQILANSALLPRFVSIVRVVIVL